MAGKRVSKEFAELNANPPQGVSISLIDESNLFLWHVTLQGPEGSPYAGGLFSCLLTLPSDYPFKAPTINFLTKIYHPNVSNDVSASADNFANINASNLPKTGSVCIGILKADEWKPATKISNVLVLVRDLLKTPNPDDPLEARIAEEYKEKRPAFEKEAKDWTKRYAIGRKK